eukprot:1146814-Pelagomonas_calceolata.AAC.3
MAAKPGASNNPFAHLSQNSTHATQQPLHLASSPTGDLLPCSTSCLIKSIMPLPNCERGPTSPWAEVALLHARKGSATQLYLPARAA